MSPTLKKILLIIGFILISALIAWGLYYLFIKTAPLIEKITAPPTGLITPGQLPTAGERAPGAPGEMVTPTAGGLPTAGVIPGAPAGGGFYQPVPVEKVSQDYAVYPSLNQSGAYRYHNAADGKFYKIGPDGALKELDDRAFYNVTNVTWAKSKDKAVIEFPDKSKIVYDFEQKKQATLPQHWENFSFSPDAEQIAAKAIGLSPENRWLVTTNDDGGGTKIIEPMGENADKVQIDWSPNRQVVGFARTADPIGGDRQQILLVGLNHENFKALTVEGLDFRPQWSPTGQKLLYSVYSQRSNLKPELWVVNAYGDKINSSRQALQLNTWAEKCSFADDSTLYCAVPKELPEGAGLSPEIARDAVDNLYKIDLRTGLKTNIPLGGDYAINNISFDASGKKIFFTDANKTGVFEAKL